MLKMEADTVHQMEDVITKSQNANQNFDTDVRDETGIENDKESEPDENKANGAIEERSIIRDGEIDKTVKSADESRIPDRDRTVENGECSERKESEAENDVRDQDIGGKKKHLADDSGTGTFISDQKTHELDENGIEEDGQIEDSESKDVEDAIDEMDGDSLIQDQTCIGKEPLTDPEIEKVISEDKLTETVKENENETETVDVNIDNDNITNEDVVQKESDSADMVTGQEVLVDTETSTDTKDVDDTG